MTAAALALALDERSDQYRRLREVDWTFAAAQTRGETHGIHPYPAKFIPQIPRTLIEILHPGDGTAVLDPFCGSGTTLLEAAQVGVPAIGVDLSPLACLISRVKVTPLKTTVSAGAKRVLKRASEHRSAVPMIPALDHWFKAEVQRALSGLVAGIEAERDEKLRDALRVALSAIVVRVSNQDSDTRCACQAPTTRQSRSPFGVGPAPVG
jgi:site-specific DNA-methyltransferase (cytosine-N4-specific)